MFKLFKYDFKSLLKTHIILYSLVLTLTLLTLILKLVTINIDVQQSSFNIFGIAHGLFRFLSNFTLFSLLLVSFILVVIKFFKSTLKDEGYLTHTLPLTKHEILFSKFFLGFAYLLINLLIITIGLFILTIKHTGIFDTFYLSYFGLTSSEQINFFFLLLYGGFTLIILYMAYLSVVFMVFAIGYSSNKSKVAKTIITGVLTYFIHQFFISGSIGVLITILFGINLDINMKSFYIIISIFLVVYSLVFVITYNITYKKTSNQLNLE